MYASATTDDAVRTLARMLPVEEMRALCGAIAGSAKLGTLFGVEKRCSPTRI